MMVQNHAFGTYGSEHAVNAIEFVRRKPLFVETRPRTFRVIERTDQHVTYRMVEPVGNEMTLPVRVFDDEFEPAGVSALPVQLRPAARPHGTGMNLEDLKLAFDRQAEAQSMPSRGILVGVALSLAVMLAAGWCLL